MKATNRRTGLEVTTAVTQGRPQLTVAPPLKRPDVKDPAGYENDPGNQGSGEPGVTSNPPPR